MNRSVLTTKLRYIREFWKESLAVLMLFFAILFFRSQRSELHSVVQNIKDANTFYLTIGILVTFFYVFFQSGMYVESFKSLGLKIKWVQAIELFLKRNFLSVFLPAGGVSSLAYAPTQLRRDHFNRTQIHQASGIYGFAGILTIVIAGLPVLLYTLYAGNNLKEAWIGMLFVLFFIAGIFLLIRGLRNKNALYIFIEKKFPGLVPMIDQLFAAEVNQKRFGMVVMHSLGVELTGMFHVYIAMLALGLQGSFGAGAVAYIFSVLLMLISPFLRGLGAVELTMVYVLELFGFSAGQALSITILYRVFEFWLPLALGLISFSWKGRQLFARLAPAILIFSLGIVNIISVVTPPLLHRLRLLRSFLPVNVINASNLMVLLIGVFLIVTSAFLIKGLRSAWIAALLLSVLSFTGNLTKALDYEEASFAAFIIIILLLTIGQYRLKASTKWMQRGLITVFIVFAAVSVFGFISFYFFDRKHFGVDFTWQQSLLHTVKIFLLVSDDTLRPFTRLGREFEFLTRALGFLSWGFLLFTLIQPYLYRRSEEESSRVKAKELLALYGRSAVDYFKINSDKLLFFSEIFNAFIAYRIANGYAVVLEEPVCAEEVKPDVLAEFDKQCRRMGLRTAYYRVDENSMLYFDQLRKKKLLIGQEAILEVETFTLEGKDKKSLRNGLNSLQKKGYTTTIYEAPLEDRLINELKKVSDEWLVENDREEMVFSQGMFDKKELKTHDVIVLSDPEGVIKSFMNIIPDFAPEECTYDMIRRTEDAPGGSMDALIIKLVEYAKRNDLKYINLGLVPMTGLSEHGNTPEQIIRFAAGKLKRFRHYQSQRDFKEKYAALWENKYLVYENDFDLLQLPAALNKVMQPVIVR